MDRNEYLEIVAAQVRCKRAVPYLKEELEDHIQDQKEAFLAQGMNPFEAEMAAVKEMGDPVETGVQLDQVHRPKMEWKVIAGAVVLGIIGLFIQASILSVVNPQYLSQEIMKQTITLGAGTGIMMLLCYTNYSVIIKFARKVWWILIIILCINNILDIRIVNGVNTETIRIAYFTIPAYAAFVYSWKRCGIKGLIVSLVGVGLLSILLIGDIPFGWVLKFCLVDFIVLGYAIYKNWFQISKEEAKRLIKKGLYALSGIGVISGACWIYGVISWGDYSIPFVPQYYIDRLLSFLTGSRIDYIAEEIQHFLQNGGNEIETQFLQGYIQSDYIWLFIIEHLGKTTGYIIASIFIVFTVILMKRIYEQKNDLGKILVLACTMFLAIESLVYIGGNLGITPFMGSFLPFMGDGIVATVVTYFYMGIILSVFRNTNVVRN